MKSYFGKKFLIIFLGTLTTIAFAGLLTEAKAMKKIEGTGSCSAGTVEGGTAYCDGSEAKCCKGSTCSRMPSFDHLCSSSSTTSSGGTTVITGVKIAPRTSAPPKPAAPAAGVMERPVGSTTCPVECTGGCPRFCPFNDDFCYPSCRIKEEPIPIAGGKVKSAFPMDVCVCSTSGCNSGACIAARNEEGQCESNCWPPNEEGTVIMRGKCRVGCSNCYCPKTLPGAPCICLSDDVTGGDEGR